MHMYEKTLYKGGLNALGIFSQSTLGTFYCSDVAPATSRPPKLSPELLHNQITTDISSLHSIIRILTDIIAHRFSKRQARAPEIMNEVSTYRDPLMYNEWPVYTAIPRAAPR